MSLKTYRCPDTPRLDTLEDQMDHVIQKWKTIVEKLNEDYDIQNYGPNSCAFCMLYANNDCEGCPIYEVTGESGCSGTPYPEFHNCESPKSAQAMLTYLEQLAKKNGLIKNTKLQDIYNEIAKTDKTHARIEDNRVVFEVAAVLFGIEVGMAVDIARKFNCHISIMILSEKSNKLRIVFYPGHFDNTNPNDKPEPKSAQSNTLPFVGFEGEQMSIEVLKDPYGKDYHNHDHLVIREGDKVFGYLHIDGKSDPMFHKGHAY